MAPKAVDHISSDESQELLDLAVSCKFITAKKEEQILPGVLAFARENPKESLAKFLLAKKVFSKEKLNLLFSIKNHLETLMADRRFGKLGVANQFVSADKVKKALEVQVEIFKKKKRSIKIGDILVQSHDISVADKTALLLTQDRIRDELLPQALSDMAKNEIEQMQIDRRFGAIAVKKKLITSDQLNKALKLQKKEAKENKPKRYLGDILKQFYGVSDQDIMGILKTQKKLETRRMNLEEKLEEYHQEKESVLNLEPFFEYRVSDDNLTAFVRKIKISPDPINLSDFLNWFSSSGIQFGLCDQREISAFLAGDDPEQEIEIANGIPPRDYVDESVDFKFDTRFSDPDKLEDEKGKALDPADAPEVGKNDLLAVVTPYEEGKPGTDVFGRPIQVKEKPEAFFNSGEGVYREENRFIAEISGQPRLYKNRTIFVIPPVADSYPTEEIKGDITEDTDDRYTSCVLKVVGTIGPDILVTCRDLIVEGDILGDVDVKGDIDVRGNIGKIPGGVKDTETPAQILSTGDVQVTGNIMNASVTSGKGVRTPKGDIVSSSISACRDIVVKNIYSSRKAPSVIRITREYVLEIETVDKAIKEVTDELDKLTHKNDLKKLTDQLIAQGQVQNGYLEKQNAIVYLSRVLEDTDLKDIQDMAEKLKAFDDKNTGADGGANKIIIPENTKAYKFMMKLVKKLSPLNGEERNQYLKEFQDSISQMYKAAAKATEKINKKYTAMTKAIEMAVGKVGPKINLATEKIERLNGQKDRLLLEQKKTLSYPDPIIKVKNQVEKYTVVMGEKAKQVIKEPIHGVSIKEKAASSDDKAKMLIEGFFE